MTVTMTIKTTPGRPGLAMVVMAGLLLLAGLAAWGVAAYKAHVPIVLSQPVALPGLPLKVAVPADWVAVRPPPGIAMVLAEPGGSTMQSARQLIVYTHRAAKPASPESLLADLFEGLTGNVKMAEPRRFGPLPARQALIIIPVEQGLQKQLVRVALIGDSQYLVLRLACLGPPTPYEYRLMDRVAESALPVQAATSDQVGYVALDKLAGQDGVAVGSGAGDWLAWRHPEATPDLVLLPTARHDGKPADFWGVVHLEAMDVGHSQDLAATLKAQASGQSLDERTVDTLKIAGLAVWRARWVAKDDADVVYFRYLFRPAAGPAAVATSQPDAADSTRAIYITAWSSADDEAAAVAAIERLIGVARLP